MMAVAKMSAVAVFLGAVLLQQQNLSAVVALLLVVIICGGISVFLLSTVNYFWGQNGGEKTAERRNTNGSGAVDLHHRIDSPRGH